MRRDSTIYAAPPAEPSPPQAAQAPRRGRRLAGTLARALAAGGLVTLLMLLVYQLPVTHVVDVGGYDAAYTQGFYDPVRAGAATTPAALEGSDGSARWTRDSSFLVFPQAGLPAQITLRLRAPAGAPREVVVLLNGAQELGRVVAGPSWQAATFSIDGGLLKPNDVVIELRTATAPLGGGDDRLVGVLLDRATYQVGPAPIVPYPPQLLYAALAAAMLWLLVAPLGMPPPARQVARSQAPWRAALSPALLAWACGALAIGGLFLLLYRLQMPYPYPLLRLLPALDGALAALVLLRYGPALVRRLPALPDTLALAGVGAWLVAILLAAQQHLTLSVPGVEKDFRVFALRSAHLAGQFPAGTTSPALDGVLRADGFYNLGYPLLLWLARPLAAGNPFLAARAVAALSGALLLLAGWLLARRLLGRAPALLALVLLALSPLVVQQALYVGTDMPFAALSVLALALLVPPHQGRTSPWLAAAAGLVAGLAFLMRHPGLLLLPFGWLALWLNRTAPGPQHNTRSIALIAFTLAFAITIAPQLFVNMRDTGQPLFSQQAKNVWQAMFGDGDWGRWAEAHNEIGLAQVIAQDPPRFALNWWNNLRGFVGTGGEDAREFGQAVQLRLLGFPANWLAIAGLLGWLGTLVAAGRLAAQPAEQPPNVRGSRASLGLLLLWIALYVLAISVGLPLQGRFVLPLAPIYAAAAAWLLARLRRPGMRNPDDLPAAQLQRVAGQRNFAARFSAGTPALLAALLLLPLLWGGFGAGTAYVLRSRPPDEPARARAAGRAEAPGQPADELAIIQRVLARLQPGERIIVRADPAAPIGKYSAIAHLVQPAPADDSPATLRASGAAYLIWSAALGPAPELGLPTDTAGIYRIYRLKP